MPARVDFSPSRHFIVFYPSEITLKAKYSYP